MSEKDLSVYDIYKSKAEDKRREADERSEEAYRLDGRIKEIDSELASMGLKMFKVALTDGADIDAEYKKIEGEIKALRLEKAERLRALSLPADYTDVKYDCDKCMDTGYVGIKMCDCLKKEIAVRSYKSSGIGKYLENQRFDNFDTSLYPFGKIRESMSSTLAYCERYAHRFSDDTAESLFFVGGTGLGKTHLSSAIAKAVIDKGYSVCYDSAHNIISLFEKERFSADTSATDKFFSTDLLIIDDLGTEINSKSSVSYLYTLINTRLISSKPTVISTNLMPSDLKRQYEDRIVSRLLGEYSVFLFEGEDIRKLKK